MKLIEEKRPNCDAPLSISSGKANVTCQYCGSNFIVANMSLSNERSEWCEEDIGAKTDLGKFDKTGEIATEFSYKADSRKAKGTRKTWLWVLGWIFIFPIPLTLVMLKNERVKSIKAPIRVLIIVAGWLLYLAIGAGGGGVGVETYEAQRYAGANTGEAEIVRDGR